MSWKLHIQAKLLLTVTFVSPLQLALSIVYIAVGVFAAGWIGKLFIGTLNGLLLQICLKNDSSLQPLILTCSL